MFAYLNASGRKPVTAIRKVLETWFLDFPKAAQRDLRGRFRSLEDETHLASFSELYMYTLLSRMRLKLEVHPALKSGKSTHPDFLVSDERGRNLFYLETTTAARSRKTIGSNKRMSALLDMLDKTHSPNFYLDVTYEGSPESPVPAATLKKELERWLADFDPDELLSLMTSQGLEAMPRREWEYKGLTLNIVAIPKGSEGRGVEGGRAIGALMPGAMSLVTCATDIRKALESKANHYGRPDLPMVIAINNLTSDFGRHDHNMEALFGQEVVRVMRESDGSSSKPCFDRLPNGAWRGPSGFRMKRVSAAIIVNGLNPFNVHSNQPILYHHPCPDNSISQDTLSILQYVPKENRMVAVQGMAVADLLSLPPGFPPEDD